MIKTTFIAAGGIEIALTVFIMLTVILGAFVIMLFASERFRSAIFRDTKPAAEEKPKPKTEKTKPEEKDKEKPARAPARPRKKPEDDDGVITVPIGFPTQAAGDVKERDIMASIRAAEKKPAKEASSDGVYVTRSVGNKKTAEDKSDKSKKDGKTKKTTADKAEKTRGKR